MRRSRQKLGRKRRKIFWPSYQWLWNDLCKFVIFLSSILPVLGEWSGVSILLTDGDIVRWGIWQAKAQVPFGVRFKCVVNTAPTLAQVEKFTYTTNYRGQKESGRGSGLNTRRNVFNGLDKILCSFVSIEEIVWDCLIPYLLSFGLQPWEFKNIH